MLSFETDNSIRFFKERLKYIYQTVRDIEIERNRSEQSLNEVIKAHEKVTPDDKVTPYYQQKLRNLYNTAVQDAQREEDLLRKALVKINEIRAIRNERRIQVCQGRITKSANLKIEFVVKISIAIQ